jgi:hypothetical protein
VIVRGAEQSALGDLSLEVDNGDVILYDTFAKRIDVELDNGAVTLARVYAQETIFTGIDNGNIRLEDAVVAKTLSFEIDKLICYAKYVKGGESPVIDENDIKSIATQSSPDEIPFAMQNAAQSWKLADMLAVLNTAREQREEPVAVLAKLSHIYLDMLMFKTAKEAALSTAEIAKIFKIKDFRVTKTLASVAKVPMDVLENAVRLAYETDKALKSAPTDPWVLLDMLIVNIYAPKSLRKG